MFVNSIFSIIFIDILNITIFIIYWNVGYKHDIIKAWQGLAVIWFSEQWFSHLDVKIHVSKSIANQKWSFISYKLCDFTANTKPKLFYCAKPCTIHCVTLIIRSQPGKILISAELFRCEYRYKIYVEWSTKWISMTSLPISKKIEFSIERNFFMLLTPGLFLVAIQYHIWRLAQISIRKWIND